MSKQTPIWKRDIKKILHKFKHELRYDIFDAQDDMVLLVKLMVQKDRKETIRELSSRGMNDAIEVVRGRKGMGVYNSLRKKRVDEYDETHLTTGWDGIDKYAEQAKRTERNQKL